MILRKIVLALVFIMVDNVHCCCWSKSAVGIETISDELELSIMDRTFEAVAVTRNCSGTNITPLQSNFLDQVFLMLSTILSEGKWTIIVFSETFFGNIEPTTKAEVDAIIEKCNTFTANHPKVLLYVNFLFSFQNSNRPAWLPEVGINTSVSASRVQCSEQEYKQLIFTHRRGIDNRISNCSVLIWNNRPISYYRKSTYCNEANHLVIRLEGTNFVAGTHEYEFGDFKDHIIPGLTGDYIEIANTLFKSGICKAPLIKSSICYDLNEMPEIAKNTKLLIINANEAPSFRRWRSKLNGILFCITSDNPHMGQHYPFSKKDGHFPYEESRHDDIDVISYRQSGVFLTQYNVDYAAL